MNCCPIITSHSRQTAPWIFWATLALVALFCLVQLHEVLPGLHNDDDVAFCPFCVIKYLLSFSVVFLSTFLFAAHILATVIPACELIRTVKSSAPRRPRSPPRCVA